jgi:dTDP-4-amino-4,6-dideoxygalactose transaminase
LSKTQAGQWRYDVIEAGYKCNMTDIHAAIGLVELERYQETLDRRKEICELYTNSLISSELFTLPIFENELAKSCFHLYMINVKNATENQRDEIITALALSGISTNVHFQPIPMLSFYKEKGYKMEDYPNAYSSYISEISLPVYYDLLDENVVYLSEKLMEITKSVMGK